MRKGGTDFVHPLTPWQRKELKRRRARNKVAKQARKVNR